MVLSALLSCSKATTNVRVREENKVKDDLPDGDITAGQRDRLIPPEDSTRKIERTDHSNDSQRIPLFKQHMARSSMKRKTQIVFRRSTRTEPKTLTFRGDYLSFEHSRKTDSVVTNIDVFLNFTNSFGNDFAHFQRNLNEISERNSFFYSINEPKCRAIADELSIRRRFVERFRRV